MNMMSGGNLTAGRRQDQRHMRRLNVKSVKHTEVDDEERFKGDVGDLKTARQRIR